ncbi:MAG: hypothetical protein BA869_06825 [Desulfuromonadales bacterium C00003107]|jgi:hypothetical protein|nr:MAG: hypothetical protein BA869_06825 [Desulfuromonadales bacterium C00003107]
MKRIRCRYLLSTLALLFVALLAGIYAFSEPLLNDLLRPRLAALAAEKLSAEVAIGRLSWQQGVLQIDALHLQRPDYYRVEVPQMRLKLGLKDLLHRHLTALEIDSPSLLLHAPTPSPPTDDGFPAHLPFNIGRLRVRNGRIDYHLAERLLSFRQVDVELREEGRYHFLLQAMLGDDEGIPLQLAGQADWRQGLQLTLQRFSWAGSPLLAEDLVLSVPADGSVDGRGRIRLAHFDRTSFEQLRSGLQLPSILPADWDFALQDAELAFELAEQKGPNLFLRMAAGQIQKGSLTIPFNQLDFTLGAAESGWRGQGTFRLAGDNPGELSGSWAAGVLQGRLVLQVDEPGRLNRQLLGGPELSLVGGLSMVADFSVQKDGGQVQIELNGLPGRPKSKQYLLDLASLRLRAELHSTAAGWTGQTRMQLKGRSDRLELQMFSSDWSHWRPLLGPALQLQALQGLIGLSGQGVLERQLSGKWALSASLGSRQMALADLRFDDLTSRWRLNRDPDGLWTGSLRFKGRRLAGAPLDLASLSGTTSLRFQQGRLSLGKLKVAAQVTGPGQTSGTLALAGSGAWQARGWQVQLAALELKDLEWLSSDGLSGLSGGRVVLRGQLNGRPGQALHAALWADLTVSEALWGQYYADLANWPSRLETQLSWHPAARGLQVKQWIASLGQIATLQGSGMITPTEIRLSGGLILPELAGPAADLFGSLFAESQPALTETHLSGGFQADFDLHNRGGWQLRGEILPRQVSFEWPAANLLLEGLCGRVPFDLAFPAGQPTAGARSRTGELQFRKLRLGPAQLAETPLRFVSQRNRVTFQVPLLLEMAGGHITVADLLLGRVAEGLLVTGHFNIDGVDLEQLTGELGLATMTGRLDADLGRIRYQGGLLSSAGEARIDAFGGSIRIGQIGLDISNLSYPQLTADIDFEAIDLYQLTQTYSFGAMNGIVDGYLHDLRLFGTTPAKFSALVESRLEGRRNISVKALNNLSILSQGGLSAALSRGLYRFIDFYRYRKIGIACELERDVFHLRGVARSDTDRYLIYGGALPPKIDIVAPPSAVSFSQMLKRLQRIERAD